MYSMYSRMSSLDVYLSIYAHKKRRERVKERRGKGVIGTGNNYIFCDKH